MLQVERKYVTIKTASGESRRFRDIPYHLQQVKNSREALKTNPDDSKLLNIYDAETRALYDGSIPLEGELV